MGHHGHEEVMLEIGRMLAQVLGMAKSLPPALKTRVATRLRQIADLINPPDQPAADADPDEMDNDWSCSASGELDVGTGDPGRRGHELDDPDADDTACDSSGAGAGQMA